MTSILEVVKSTANQSGWHVAECDGTLAAEKTTGDLYLWVDLGNIEMAARTLRPVQLFANVGFIALAEVCAELSSAISPRIKDEQQPTQLMHVFDFTAGTEIARSLSEVLNDIEQWSASLVLESQIKTFLSNRPDRPLWAQLNHLAALAYRGDIFTLADYRKAFVKGHRLNFVPAITENVIRAAELHAESIFAVQAQQGVQADVHEKP